MTTPKPQLLFSALLNLPITRGPAILGAASAIIQHMRVSNIYTLPTRTRHLTHQNEGKNTNLPSTGMAL